MSKSEISITFTNDKWRKFGGRISIWRLTKEEIEEQANDLIGSLLIRIEKEGGESCRDCWNTWFGKYWETCYCWTWNKHQNWPVEKT